VITEWGEFLHKEGKIFTDFDEIRKEIEKDTDLVAGSNKGICPDPINLKIYSDRVVNLTLIDLPGITKVPVGDQPEDIEDQIEEMVMEYIENPNSIILAVSAANTDLATSEALKFAREVDPDGERTLAVLTKLDLMDAGTNAVDVLKGRVIPVKLGIIGVVNRSQKAINENKIIDEQLKLEEEFLKENYPRLAEKNGTPYLAKTLSRLLMNHIFNKLPDLKVRVHDKAQEYETILKSYGQAVTDHKHFLIEVLFKFSRDYCATVIGSETKGEEFTKVYNIIHEDFIHEMERARSDVKLTPKDIRDLDTSHGPRPTLMSNPTFDKPFERCVKVLVTELQDPSLKCVEMIRKELQRVIFNCGNEIQLDLKRFPKLAVMIKNVVTKLIHERMVTTNEKIEELFKVETAYINKKHPDLDKNKILAKKFMKAEEDHQQSGNPPSLPNLTRDLTEKEKTTILVAFINTYYHIVRKNVQDLVPKAIMHHFVNNVIENLQKMLIAEIYKEDQAEEILTESNNISARRKEASEMLEVG
jgi:dynamin 1-like protein